MNRGRAWEAFSLYVKVRDADPFTGLTPCCTCGQRFPWKEMDAGHFVAWGAGGATKYDEENVHAQCVGCNRLGDGARFQFAKFIDRKFGRGHAAALVVRSKKVHKVFPFELVERAKHWRSETARLRKEKNI